MSSPATWTEPWECINFPQKSAMGAVVSLWACFLASLWEKHKHKPTDLNECHMLLKFHFLIEPKQKEV